MKTFEEVVRYIQSEISDHKEKVADIEKQIDSLSEGKNFHLGIANKLEALIDPGHEKSELDVKKQSVCEDEVKIKCITCGKEIHKKSPKAKYCSKQCQRKYNNKKHYDKIAMKKKALRTQEDPF